MKAFALVFASFFISIFAHATRITSAYYNPVSQTLNMEVVYSGGLKEHNFHLVWDDCKVIKGQKQIAARLIDSGWDDTGTEEIFSSMSFDLSNLDCKPSLLTVRSGRYSHITLEIY